MTLNVVFGGIMMSIRVQNKGAKCRHNFVVIENCVIKDLIIAVGTIILR